MAKTVKAAGFDKLILIDTEVQGKNPVARHADFDENIDIVLDAQAVAPLSQTASTKSSFRIDAEAKATNPMGISFGIQNHFDLDASGNIASIPSVSASIDDNIGGEFSVEAGLQTVPAVDLELLDNVDTELEAVIANADIVPLYTSTNPEISLEAQLSVYDGFRKLSPFGTASITFDVTTEICTAISLSLALVLRIEIDVTLSVVDASNWEYPVQEEDNLAITQVYSVAQDGDIIYIE